MIPPTTTTAGRIARRLATAAALIVALGWGGAARAATHDAGHHCKCAEKCKGAACCCPSDSHEAAPAKVEKPNPTTPKPVDAPCARSAPCGHPDLPAPGSSRPVSRTAALWSVPPRPSASSARFCAASDDSPAPPPPTSRLDDPPEA